MSTTLTNATLVVTIVENVMSNGQSIDSTNYLTIAGINQIDKRIVTVPTTLVNLLQFGATVGAGTIIAANLKHLRITNKDSVNYVTLMYGVSGGQVFFVKLEAGKSFIVGNVSESANITGAAWSAFVNATFLGAFANESPVALEMFVATV